MNHRTRVRVVEVEDVGADAVQKCRIEHIEAFGAPDHGCLLPPRKRRKHRDRMVDGLVAAAAERSREVVEKGSLCLVLQCDRHVLGARVRQKPGKRA